jgi:hypothetical protein
VMFPSPFSLSHDNECECFDGIMRSASGFAWA